MKLKLLTATAIVLFSTTSLAQEAKKWHTVIEVEGRVNADRSIGYPKVLIPLMQDESSLLYTDIRSRFDDLNSEEYNLGLGYRKIVGDWIYGGYGFIDHLSSANGFEYWQGTAGLEMLSEDWDIRINGYLPESTENSLGGGGAPSLTIDGGGNFSLSTGGGFAERALPGFDAEVGYKLPINGLDLRVFGGMYHFAAAGFEDVTGPKARVELTLDDRHISKIPAGMEFTIGAQFQNDGPREDTGTIFAQIRVPFGGSESKTKLNPLERRMTNFIERDVDIIAGQGGTTPATTEAAEVTINGETFQGIDATVDATTVNIQGALNAVNGAPSLVLFDGSAGDIDFGSDQILLNNNQVIIGAGSVLSATGLTSNNTMDATLAGVRPTIVNGTPNVSDSFIRIDNINAAIVGVDFRAMDHIDNAIEIYNTTGGQSVLVKDVAISALDQMGLYMFGNAGSIRAEDVRIDDTTMGYYIHSSSDVTISGGSISNTSSTGLAVVASSHGITVENIEISNVANGHAVYTANSNNVNLTGITANNVDYGIYVTDAINATVENSTVTDSANIAFGFALFTGATASNLQANNVGTGLYIDTSDNIDFTDVSVTGAASGLRMFTSDDIQLANVSLTDISATAIEMLNLTNSGGAVTLAGTAPATNCDATGVNTNTSIAIGGSTCP